MGQILWGAAVLIFGVVVGGVGLASAGVGIGVPMIPLGIYLIVRGAHGLKSKNAISDKTTPLMFERSKLGGLATGVLFILFGVATSAFVIGVPLVFIGVIMVGVNLWRFFKSLSEKNSITNTSAISKKCSGCNADNNPIFVLCWKCGLALSS